MTELQTSQPEIPQAIASEETYIAALVAGQISEGALFLDPEEFFGANHAAIYHAAAARLMSGEPMDAALLTNTLAQSGALDIAGGREALASYEQRGRGITPTIADQNARVIREKAVARRIQSAALRAIESAPLDIDGAIKKLMEAADSARSRLSMRQNVELTDAKSLRSKFGKQEWLWPGYIPIGHVTCLMAQQGQGKSNVALDFCHRLAIGADFPDGEAPGIQWNPDTRILYLDAEGFLQGILTRMSDWGTPDAPFIWPAGCDDKQWALNTPTGWSEFESIIAQYRPRLVIVDSLSAANTLEEKDNDQMKTLMQKFVHLAKHWRLALVLIHHLRKAGTGELSWPVNLDRARGASMITQLCRVVLAVGTPDLSTPERRRLETIKNNLAAFAPAQGFEIFSEGLGWGEAPEAPQTTKPRDAARAWLLDFLSDADRKLATDIVQCGEEAGFSQRTLYRAKEEIGVHISREGGQNGRTFWGLPNQSQSIAA